MTEAEIKGTHLQDEESQALQATTRSYQEAMPLLTPLTLDFWPPEL